MRVPNASAREIWSSAEEIDAHVDAVKAELIARDANEQVLNSIEQYREHLQNSMATGEPMSNSNMESFSFSNPQELVDELGARGLSPETF